MARVTGRKLRPTHVAQGGALPFDFGAEGEYRVFGFHMHPRQRLQVEVPIFDHGFYPKLDHTPTDIKQEIKYRMVQMPSLADLRKAGVDAARAIYAADIQAHPRYIKNKNYFRNDFAANMKAYAKRENVVIVLPANDMIEPRFKRKEVLQMWRSAFTPLLIEGRQYTSGRITHFFVAPPAVSQKFRMHLNLEHDEDANNLVEWDPATWQLAQTQRTPRNPRMVPLDDREVDRMAERLADEIAPLVSSKVDGSMTPEQKKRLHELIAEGEMAESLVHETKGKTGTPRLQAAKRWVRQTAWPRIKDFLAQESIEVSRAVGSFIWMTTVAIAVNHVVDKFKGAGSDLEGDVLKDWAKRNPWKARVARHAQNFQYNMDPGGVSIGGGTLTYTGGQRIDKNKLLTILRESALQFYMELARDPQIGLSGEEIFDIDISGGRVKVTLNQQKLMDAIRHGEIGGRFVDTSRGMRKLNLNHARRVSAVTIRSMEQRLNQTYRDLKKQGY